jgi:hypothetical protein
MDFMKWARIQADRVIAALLLVAGIVLVIVGYFDVSGTPYAAKQIPYLISAGLTAVFCLGIAAMLWLSADLRDEWQKLDNLNDQLGRHGPEDWSVFLLEIQRLTAVGGQETRGGDATRTRVASFDAGIAHDVHSGSDGGELRSS